MSENLDEFILRGQTSGSSLAQKGPEKFLRTNSRFNQAGSYSEHFENLDTLWGKVEFAFEKNIGTLPEDDEGWKTVSVYSKVLHAVALLSGRVLVSAPLCRDEEWIRATITYTVILGATVGVLWKRPWWKAEEMLKPFFERKATCLLSHTPQKSGKIDVKQLAHDQLTVSLAAIHTTSITISHLLYDLATYPEHVASLREELESVTAEHNSWRKWKIEQGGIDQVVENGYFHKGDRIPREWMLRLNCDFPNKSSDASIPHLSIDFTVRSHPPSRNLLSSPFDTFDGFRFSKLQSVPWNENRYQFVTSSTESLNFGHGRRFISLCLFHFILLINNELGTHTCPGRFFASDEIKIALAEKLLRWDVRLKPGKGRPANLSTDTNVMTNMKGEIQMRRRELL
ncbi:150cd699-1ab4-4a03-a415-fc84fbc5bb8d-CDS [Sclerotinia trifoliorum]|uniref:150cd699-1ab4-4a03-a415-fc84fbc5bb8d-CDS n=1 Tax=Sclerotinia trifoliorum TaxID=28548 RepID=A0A8H2ZSF2_9HELO|nr:150cd699-1ab4-4a03-a415-fc84fbc5bb8d-CDS [Sclerotinia trifoliorum]